MSHRDDGDDSGSRDDGDRRNDVSPTEEELVDRLDELEATLRDLRAELRDGGREGRRTRDGHGRDRRGPPTTSPLPQPPRPPGLPRPPRLSELLRFTEQYTIPTLIATLETTIKSLELLRGTLRLVDPDRDLRESADDARSTGGVFGRAATDATREGLADVRSEAERGLARSLAELRRALDEADLPEDAASRTILEDARDLSGEIEARIREERDRGRDRRRERDAEREADVVRIDVRGPDETADEGKPDADGGEDAEADDRPSVNVESELESIKDELDRRKADREDGALGDADGDGKSAADSGDRNGSADSSDRNGSADSSDGKGTADEGPDSDKNRDADDSGADDPESGV